MFHTFIKIMGNGKIRSYWLLVLLGMFCWVSVYGQQTPSGNAYTIDINVPEKKIVSELELGGTNVQGETISVNNYYLSQNGKPIIPITGEFHFSRYPEAYWEEAIQKMKAGGINMVATYVFWILHEEEEGVFNFEGNRNVRKFVELCAQHNMPVIVRIGPFGHGEIRNGDLPDWILAKPMSIRSNDPDYLFYAERLYNEIGKQLKGLFFKDGGPIIGTQIENEYQPSAAPWGLTYPGQPYLVDEYGGTYWLPSFVNEEPRGTRRGVWGYGKTAEEVTQLIHNLTKVLTDNPKIAGYTYTQLTDVFQETNGIYTFNRELKFPMEKIRKALTQTAAIENE